MNALWCEGAVSTERELKRYLFDGFSAFLEYLASVVSQGQGRGEVGKGADPEIVARVLFTYLHGLHRLSPYEFDVEARRAETRAFVSGVLPSP